MLRGIVALCSLVLDFLVPKGQKDEGETLDQPASENIYPEDTDSPLSVLLLGASPSVREYQDTY